MNKKDIYRNTDAVSLTAAGALNHYRFLMLLLLFSALFLLPEAMAQLPVGDGLDLPGIGADAKWYQKLGGAIIFGLVILFIGGLLFGLAMAVISLFRLIGDAKETGEWGKVIVQVIIILIIIAFAFAIFYLANEFGFNPLKEYLGL